MRFYDTLYYNDISFALLLHHLVCNRFAVGIKGSAKQRTQKEKIQMGQNFTHPHFHFIDRNYIFHQHLHRCYNPYVEVFLCQTRLSDGR